MSVVLVVDARETRVIAQLELRNILFITEQLPVGDFIFKKGDTVLAIIERKTHSDFCSSVSSGRFREQRERLKQYALDNQGVVTILLLEGLDELPPSCLGTLENLVLYHKLSILPTMNIQTTAQVLEHMIKKLEVALPHDNLVVSTVGVSRGVKLGENIFQHQLALVQGVSLKVAGNISEKYDNCKKLITALEESGPLLLQDIVVGKRKLGKVVSTRIHSVFMGF